MTSHLKAINSSYHFFRSVENSLNYITFYFSIIKCFVMHTHLQKPLKFHHTFQMNLQHNSNRLILICTKHRLIIFLH